MNRDELDKIIAYRNEYNRLKGNIEERVAHNYKKIEKEYDMIVDLGIKKMPLGYLCIARRNMDDIFNREEYFWVDQDGNTSMRYSDKWDVYYDARTEFLNNFPLKNLTDEENSIIRFFDKTLNTKIRTHRLGRY
jgi:hypothetical protein